MSIGSNLAKFVLGVSLAIAILLAGGVAVALFLVSRNSQSPPKPIFANDQPTLNATPSHPKVAVKAHNPSLTAVKPSSTPTPTNKLEPGAYRARITWPDGLSLRSGPSSDAEHIGSLSYNQQVVVLSESQDQNWQHVRVEDSGQEGWVKAGNTARTEPSQ